MLLSVGADLPYLTGYEAMPLERLTMLVLPRDGEATLVVPELEAPRVERNGSCTVVPWTETVDPIGIVATLVGGGPQGGDRRPHLDAIHACAPGRAPAARRSSRPGA